jgi:transcriptional regulator with XRE-family HTH domain
MTTAERKRDGIRRQYKAWRALADLTQEQVEEQARRVYPEFPKGKFWSIEKGLAYPSPTERKALAKALKVAEADLPTEPVEEIGDQAVAS